MKIIRNNIIPFKGFKAINLFGLLFVRKDAYITEQTINHEKIHTAQIKELLYIPFYICYLIEYMYLRWNNTAKLAYKKISFEKEAYDNESNLQYLNRRKHYGMWK